MNDIWEWLLQIDRQLFLWINGDLGSALLDRVLPWCRERIIWAPFYLFVLAFCVVNFGTAKGLALIAALGITVGLADFTSSQLIKKNVKRPRPCNEIALRGEVRLRIAHCGGGYSFTSSHAANHFAVALFLILTFGGIHPLVRPILLTWASIIAFSQVYVGVHYPLDISCGALLGAAIGWGIGRAFKRLFSFQI